MQPRNRILARALGGLALLLLAGCGPSRPATADPARSVEVLRTTLDAWKQGDKLEGLRDRSPAIHANDPDWAAGAKLERYEIRESEGTHVGYDYGCPVTLWVRSATGPTKQRAVRFVIGTSPRLVVLREVGG